MPLKWSEVIEKDEYKKLPDGDKANAKLAYFDDVVAPQVPPDQIGVAKSEFLKDAGRIEIERDKPSFFKEVIGKTILEAPSRAAGMALGAVNSPLAFVWGSQEAQHVDEEQYNKMPFWKKTAVSIGGGIDSMLKSTFKKGEWGTLYGDYYKTVRNGKGIGDDLPEGVKWAEPTIEFLANVVSDPLIVSGVVKNLARFRVPKEWIGKIPEKITADLARMEALELGEKKALQGKILEAFKSRRDYIKWWEEQPVSQFERTVDYIDRSKRAPRLGGARTPKTIEQMGGKVVEKTEPEISKTIRAIQAKNPVSPVQNSTETLAKINNFRKSKGLSPIKLRASAGAGYGIEEDEEGNITYDIKKGLAGTVAMAGGMKIVPSAITKSKGAVKFLAKNPALNKVLSGIGKEKQIYTLPEIIQKANIKLFDRFAPIKGASMETYEAARKFQAYKDQALVKFRPLVDAFKPVRKDNLIATGYIKAHRDLTRAERGLKNPGGVTLQDAKKAIMEAEEAWIAKGRDLKELQSTRDAFNQWTHDEILHPFYESGFLSKEGYESIVKNNKWYAAYDVIEHMPDDMYKIPALNSSEYYSKGNQSVIKAMKGTEKVIDDPIDATIRKFTLAQHNIAQNKVASTLVDDLINRTDADVLIRPIAANQKEFAMLKQSGKTPFMERGFNKKEWGTINRFKDGHVERYAVSKELADSMKQLSTYQAPRLIQAYNAIFRATATTLSPAFLIRNVFRDALLGYISSPYHGAAGAPKFAYDWGRGAWEATKHVIGKPSLVDDYVAAGGSFGWSGAEAFEGAGKQAAKKMLFAKPLHKQAAAVIKSPFKLIEKANEIAEMAPRLGIFERGMKVGSIDDAVMAGRQATIDFNRGGTWLKVANQFVPFLNARVQAKVTLFDALKRDPKGTSAKIISTVILPGLAVYSWNKLYHPDLYDDIPEQIRQDNFCIIYGKKMDEDTGRMVPEYLALPKGDAGTLFNPFEFALQSHYSENPKSAKEFAINFLSDLSPVEFAREGKASLSKVGGSLVPPILKAPLEDWANLRFYQGNEIVPYWIGKTKPPELQFKEATPEFYKWLGKKAKVSPLRIQNYMSNAFTTYGRIGFSPQAMEDVIKGAILKDSGGEQEAEAWKQIKYIENGYNTMRAYAEEAVSNGDSGAASQIINEWNRGLFETIEKYNNRFSKYGLNDQGGLRRSYFVNANKRRNILLKRSDNKRFIQKKLERN